jgi:hypothetical protein
MQNSLVEVPSFHMSTGVATVFTISLHLAGGRAAGATRESNPSDGVAAA